MAVSVTMPQLGESVTEGTVTRWLKAEGEYVNADEPLLEVSTDKVDTEIPSPASGVLLRITAGEDAVVPVGGELAVIGDAAEIPSSVPAPTPAYEAPAPEPEAAYFAGAPAAPEPAFAPAPPSNVPTAHPEPAYAPAADPAPAAVAPDAGSATPVLLPALGESVTEGTVTRWLKQVGDPVAVDEPLVEVSTDKVDTEIPSPVAGILLEINVPADAIVAVGGQLGLIGAAGAAPAPAPAPAAAAAAAAEPAPDFAPVPAFPQVPVPASSPARMAAGAASAESGDASYVTPLVRKLATEHGVDLASVAGTGVGGRIRKADVLEAAARAAAEAKAAAAAAAPAAAAATPPAPTPSAGPSPAVSPLRGRTEPMSRLRKLIAARMVESLQTTAQLTTVVEVDVTRIAQLREKVKRDFESREGVKLSYLPFFAKASVEALKQHPQLNASIDTAAGTVTYHESEHLGVAVDTERGLLVPVIHDAGDLNIAGLARRIADLAARTRTNKITPDELSGGTFTLTNTGSRGALFDTPIINQPQAAILGTGAVVKRPVVVSDNTGTDSIAVRSMVYLALTYDHRLVDGADAARFLVAVKARLEEASFDAELGI